MSDPFDAPDVPIANAKHSRELIAWTREQLLPGETEATRVAWAIGLLVLLRQRCRRAHISQQVPIAYHLVVAAEQMRTLAGC